MLFVARCVRTCSPLVLLGLNHITLPTQNCSRTRPNAKLDLMSFHTELNQLLLVNFELAFKFQPMSCDHTAYLLEDESHALNFLPAGI
jgi:hypothetical protein